MVLERDRMSSTRLTTAINDVPKANAAADASAGGLSPGNKPPSRNTDRRNCCPTAARNRPRVRNGDGWADREFATFQSSGPQYRTGSLPSQPDRGTMSNASPSRLRTARIARPTCSVGYSHSGATRSCVRAATICLHPRQIDLRSIAQFAFDLGVTDGHIFH